MPGSVSVLLRFGTTKSEAVDTFWRGCEEDDDLVVFNRYVEEVEEGTEGDSELGSEDDVEGP